jgi:hypothetical protein
MMFVPMSVGGLFSLSHLWFLYYLLWLCALVLGLRFLVTRSEPVASRLRGWADGWVALLNLIALTVLFASYHYLVRSSFIGRMLNGQSYPFVAWPFAQLARRPDDVAEREGSMPKQK